jgi:hypothetical protein
MSLMRVKSLWQIWSVEYGSVRGPARVEEDARHLAPGTG